MRPTLSLTAIANGSQQWDTEINDNLDGVEEILLTEPLPPASFASEAALTSAHDPADYEGCIAAVDDTTDGWFLCMSDGTSWVRLPYRAAAVADLSLTMSASYSRPEVQQLSNKIDELLAVLRAANVIAP